jgi:GNAT superfamily N-acetyltransferase
MGLMQLTGPSPASALFYGGYILGSEPYHPHWAVEGTEAYVRAGYHITAAEVLMVRDLTKPIAVDESLQGYEIVEAPDAREYGARAFGFLGMHSNHEIAYCYARLYPALIGPSGGAVGQSGGVATGEAHRGHGLARVMTQMCLRQLAAWGGAEAILSTGLNNGPALRAYERAGFERRHHACEWTRTL